MGDLISLSFSGLIFNESIEAFVPIFAMESGTLTTCALIFSIKTENSKLTNIFIIDFLYKVLCAIFVCLLYISAAKAKKIYVNKIYYAKLSHNLSDKNNA